VLSKAEGCDAVIVMVRHDAYLNLDPAALKAKLSTPC
jgi:UDP-N-acetyl-D-mannosaminuronate dehydrogenase